MMIRALLRKQLRELGAAFLRSSKTGKARSRASAVGYTLLFAVLVVVLILINGCTGFYQAYVAHFPVFVTVGPWLRSLVVFRPDVVLMETVPLFLQIHVVSAFTLFALIPFSRLVHIFSVPVTYALRPFQIYRRRYAGL